MRHPRFIAIQFLTAAALLLSNLVFSQTADYEETDTISNSCDSILVQNSKGWVNELIKSGFRINSPNIRYPRFAQFCVNVYNWGDRTFNSYDPEYVVSTGKNWKFIADNNMWMRTYVMHFTDNSLLHISSHLYDDMGIKLCFMAVNVGYTWNLNSLLGQKTDRKSFDFSFTSSKFAASYFFRSTSGNSTIRRFGNYNNGHRLDVDFNDIKVDDTHFDIYYFFNNQHYSQAAAYCFSKYQLKSAGSWLLGFSYSNEKLNINLSDLPEAMLEALPTDQLVYGFRHKDYSVIGGYAYNKVFKPKKWLLNITVLPSLGYKHASEKSTSIRDMLALNFQAMGALVYNHRDLFVSLQGKFNGYTNFGKDYTMFYCTTQMITSVGFRF